MAGKDWPGKSAEARDSTMGLALLGESGESSASSRFFR
ncbi:hypothetical protein MGWOODY_Smn497 [hydrothermal vent metagenome]|jgi:hypothetical protein|uniref:Uncharacterized protein n=1 Tax=hydrothermal vent metagenome TaxID=652676 RepID=A0A170PPU6_9ZZZZ